MDLVMVNSPLYFGRRDGGRAAISQGRLSGNKWSRWLQTGATWGPRLAGRHWATSEWHRLGWLSSSDCL